MLLISFLRLINCVNGRRPAYVSFRRPCHWDICDGCCLLEHRFLQVLMGKNDVVYCWDIRCRKAFLRSRAVTQRSHRLPLSRETSGWGSVPQRGQVGVVVTFLLMM